MKTRLMSPLGSKLKLKFSPSFPSSLISEIFCGQSTGKLTLPESPDLSYKYPDAVEIATEPADAEVQHTAKRAAETNAESVFLG